MRRLTKNVDHGDGAVGSIPNPAANEEGGLEWCLRYACSDRVALGAASVIGTFEYMLGSEISANEAIRRLRQMRAAYREQ